MQHHLIAERYAKGLGAAIVDDAQLDEALAALEELSDLYQHEHDLRTVLVNPTINPGARTRVLGEVLRRLAPPKMVSRLLHVMLNRGRLPLLPDVATLFAKLVDARLNRVAANVSTVAPLSAEQEARLRDGLAAYSGKAVRMKSRIDERQIGGVVVWMDGLLIDGSLQTRLARMKQELASEEV